MTVIFLDIDGVMIPTLDLSPDKIEIPNLGKFDRLKPECVDVLNRLYRHFHLNIVISSDWTINNITKLSAFQTYLEYHGIDIPVIGFTQKTSKNNVKDIEYNRATEICEWVRTHNPENWVALDDYNLKSYIHTNFVRITDDEKGLAGNDENGESFYNIIYNKLNQ